MKDTELYIKIEQSVSVTNPKVFLEDVATIFCVDKNVEKEAGKQVLKVFTDTNTTSCVFSFMKVVELLHKMNPSLGVVNMGENDFVLNFIVDKKHSRVFEYTKTLLIGLIVFVGTAFTIMTFDTDVSVSDVFSILYELFTGQPQKSGSILEISYAVGLPVGTLLFYNHFKRRRRKNDPTPIHVEMRTYEEQMNKAMIKEAAREGKTLDAS